MEETTLDMGLVTYPLGFGQLRFNPTDPNLYDRFLKGMEALEGWKLPADVEPVEWLQKTDRELKDILTQVFGQENDFDRILGGVSLLALAGNGKYVLENLLLWLEPVLADGAKKCVEALTRQELAAAKTRRDAL